MGKRYAGAKAKVEKLSYGLKDALSLVKEIASAKFDESVEASVKLGVDPKHSDQMVRGSCVLPHGLGKTVTILVFAKGEKEREAINAGADFVGSDDMVEKVSKGWMDFDRVVATPDMMGTVAKLGKILGPRGLMPNPKTGTVTFDIARAIADIKKGQVEFRVDKGGVVHAAMGKVSFDVNKLKENSMAFFEALLKAKPAASKGVYFQSIYLSSTMGPGVKIETLDVTKSLR